jgi:SAM-dependent methyltransferase
VELGVFDELARSPLGCQELAPRLGIHPRGARDFLDALVALGLIDRDASGRYLNTAEGAAHLCSGTDTSLLGVLRYLDARQYNGWGALAEALRTGAPQTGPFAAGGFAAYYADSANSRLFLEAMTSGSHLPARALATCFRWEDRASVIDIGCAEGSLPVHIALTHPHIVGGGFDLPAVELAFTEYVGRYGLSDRVRFHPGDFLRDPFPRADAIVMSRVLHDWDLQTRKLLLQKAYEALASGGVVIVCEMLVDEERRTAVQALLSSLNMLLQTAAGSEATEAQWRAWMAETGFTNIRVVPLAGPYSAVVATRP